MKRISDEGWDRFSPVTDTNKLCASRPVLAKCQMLRLQCTCKHPVSARAGCGHCQKPGGIICLAADMHVCMDVEIYILLFAGQEPFPRTILANLQNRHDYAELA